MWNKIVAWHRAMEQEQRAVLNQPELAERLPAGYRRRIGLKLARLTPVERMQMHAFLRKYEGWRGYAALGKIILVLSCMGVVLHLLAPGSGLGWLMLMSNLTGLGLLAAILAAWFNYSATIRRKLHWLAGVFLLVGVATVTGVMLRSHMRGTPLLTAVSERWAQLLLGFCMGGLMVALPLVIVTTVRTRRHRILSARLELDAERERAARELSESRLRLLHAQIEPHFLFNTLGAVQQLAEREAPRAAALTAHLIDFLRASMGQMRSETETLDKDFALIDSYLQVMSVRLGARLQYSMDLPPALRGVAVPGMMLLTLVENAIKHGIEPALRGGEIHVSAHQQGEQVQITVRDTGVGMPAQAAAGEGLANVRKRLQLIYRDSASLSVENAAGGGVQAVILIPIQHRKAEPPCPPAS